MLGCGSTKAPVPERTLDVELPNVTDTLLADDEPRATCVAACSACSASRSELDGTRYSERSAS